MRTLVWSVVVVMGAVTGAAAETELSSDEWSLPAGTRVRIVTAGTAETGHSSKTRVVGTVTRPAAASLVLRTDAGDEVLVPHEAIRQIEVSRGHRSRGRGALVGAALGAATGVLASLAWGASCGGDECRLGTGFGLLLYTPLAALAGGGMGAALPPGERWERLPNRRLSLRVRPQSDGARLAVVLSF